MHPFVNYAHRGASEYLPENTLLAFYTGLYMGANGIETDVQLSRDGVPILFHDDTLGRVTGQEGTVAQYTAGELTAMTALHGGFADRLVTLEEFLQRFAFFDLTFAIELKSPGVEAPTAQLLRRYGLQDRAVVTSFRYELLSGFRALAPEFSIGYLVQQADGEALARLRALGGEEICPRADTLEPSAVAALQAQGLRVRAWGVKTPELMVHALNCGVNGMTVNFPDRLAQLLARRRECP